VVAVEKAAVVQRAAEERVAEEAMVVVKRVVEEEREGEEVVGKDIAVEVTVTLEVEERAATRAPEEVKVLASQGAVERMQVAQKAEAAQTEMGRVR
jgi:hypothetical protein